ncbi:MAG: CpsD/CapB family tyrosine-protein kinase [Oscillospiraceae bacterium]
MKDKTKATHTRKLQIVSKAAPFAYVEAFKSLRTNLNFVSVNSSLKKLIITSAIPNEGKSSVAINLAVTLAETGSKVLIVDCDLRKPILHKYLKLGKTDSKGLTGILSGESTVDGSIVYFKDIKISVLIAGVIPPNPAELLGSKKMEELIAKLETYFDYIIFDTPPVSVVTDSAVLSKFTDGVLLVVRQNLATVEQVKLAKKSLDSVNANIIGVVLNDFDTTKGGKNSGYYYYYDYQS